MLPTKRAGSSVSNPTWERYIAGGVPSEDSRRRPGPFVCMRHREIETAAMNQGFIVIY